MKVFCSKCRHFEYHDEERTHMGGRCWCKHNMLENTAEDTYLRPGPRFLEPMRLPDDINKDNTCEWYEENSWRNTFKRWMMLGR